MIDLSIRVIIGIIVIIFSIAVALNVWVRLMP